MPQEQGPQVSVRFRPTDLKRRREREGWTQERFAEEAGISIDTYRRAERGSAVSEDSARSIGAALAVDFTTISNSSNSLHMWGFTILEDETHVLVFSCLQLTASVLKVIERLLKDAASSRNS
jgi:transcriptional regulator with XRE-family HTH domain